MRARSNHYIEENEAIYNLDSIMKSMDSLQCIATVFMLLNKAIGVRHIVKITAVNLYHFTIHLSLGLL